MTRIPDAARILCAREVQLISEQFGEGHIRCDQDLIGPAVHLETCNFLSHIRPSSLYALALFRAS